jgi:predicted transporter
LAILRGIAGGAVGGVLGYFVFDWALTQGYYALVLPGSLVGIGCGLASRRKLLAMGVLSAIGAFAVGALADWNSLANPSPTVLEHLGTLLQPNRRMPAILIFAGVAISFYFGIGRDRRR